VLAVEGGGWQDGTVIPHRCAGGASRLAGYDLTRLIGRGSEGNVAASSPRSRFKLQGISPRRLVRPAVLSVGRGAPAKRVQSVIQYGLPSTTDRAAGRDGSPCAREWLAPSYRMPETPMLLLWNPRLLTRAVPNRRKNLRRHFRKKTRHRLSGQPPRWKSVNKLWQARHDAYLGDLGPASGCKAVPTDVCVPISQLAERSRAGQRQGPPSWNWSRPSWATPGDGNFSTRRLRWIWKNAGEAPPPKALSAGSTRWRSRWRERVRASMHRAGQSPYLRQRAWRRGRCHGGRSNGRCDPR